MNASSNVTRRVFNKGVLGTALYPFLANSVKPLFAEQPAINVPPNDIAYLIAEDSLYPNELKAKYEGTHAGVKRFWVENWREPGQAFEWKVNALDSGKYEATFMVSAPPGTPIAVEGPHNKLTFETTQPFYHDYWWKSSDYYWDRITLPAPLFLPKGESAIRVHLLQPVTGGEKGAALKSIELLNHKARPAFDARIRAFKSDTSWLNDAKFGLMTQCGGWAYPPHGPRKPWPGMVDAFDVEKFADLVDSTGAGYTIWSATWGQFLFPAPINAIDEILPGRTSRRDLIGEMADALAKRKIRLILYYHAGATDAPKGHEMIPGSGSWWSKNWTSSSDKSLFVKNWCTIMTEVGERYGDRLAGWIYDDDLVYYPVPYEQMGKAAKAGSPSRIISYNPWIQARGTDFQDLQFGEGFTGSADLPESAHGIWQSGPYKGLHAHGNFQLDGPNWGIVRAEEKITPPVFSADKATEMALLAAQRNEALSWNLLMYDDGSVSEESLAVFQQAGRAVRRLYPKKQTSAG
jgi:hypothetical protein